MGHLVVKLMENIEGEAFSKLITDVEKYSEKLKKEAMELDDFLLDCGICPKYLVAKSEVQRRSTAKQ